MLAMVLSSLMAATAPVAPSPPPPPPMMLRPIVTPPRMIGTARRGVTQNIAVQVRQDGHLLWSGEISRSSTGTASFNQQLRESRACPSADRQGRFPNNDFISAGLNVSIGPNYRSDADDTDADRTVQVSIERIRPYGDSKACAGERGSSTVRFTAVAQLVHGQPVMLAGEGGVSLSLILR